MSLSTLSNEELMSNLKTLVIKEREILHDILTHIKEAELRKVYLDKACPSMYEYLTQELGYSGSAAIRRLQAARLLTEVPLIQEEIKSGHLNLSQIGEVIRAVKEKEKSHGVKVSSSQKTCLVQAILKSSTQQTQVTLAKALDIKVKDYEKTRAQQDESLRIEITLTKQQHEKLKKCRDLLAAVMGQNHTDHSWSDLFETLADQYLASKNKKDTLRLKASNKHKKSKQPSSRQNVVKDQKSTTEAVSQSVVRSSKKITPRLRRKILSTQKCCQYIDSKTGKKCGSTYGLEVDHIKPRWAGGDNSPNNLQVLCKAHNIFKYRRESNLSFVT